MINLAKNSARFFLLSILLFPIALQAQSGTVVYGEITAVNKAQKIIVIDGKETYSLADDAKIAQGQPDTKYYREMTIKDLMPGQQIKIDHENSQVRSIRVTPPKELFDSEEE